MEEFFLDIKVKTIILTKNFFIWATDSQEWLIPSKATYGNPQNSYSSMYTPVLYDYIWHKAKGQLQAHLLLIILLNIIL